MCAVLFGCIWDLLIALQNSVQNGLNWCKSLCHEVVSEFFATNTPDWPRWDLNSCFGVFHTIWVHLVPLVCLTKLRAKWAEVVQMFVPWSRVGIFWNERSRSTPLDPNLMFRCVLYYLGAFGTVWVRYNTQCKTGQTGAKVRAMKSRQNFSLRAHKIHPIWPLTDVLVHFVPFGCIQDRLVVLQNSFQNGPN